MTLPISNFDIDTDLQYIPKTSCIKQHKIDLYIHKDKHKPATTNSQLTTHSLTSDYCTVSELI